MIPLKIQLKNFLSYGMPAHVIDFSAHNLICLSGKNGHGKTALLDAITWALWGQARKTGIAAKADEGLMRLGQTSMMVSLDFIAQGNRYRVRREFAGSSSKPYAALDFGMFEGESDTIRSLTDKTIRATQAKIDETLGIHFDTFVNSAFLRQGQSNEFSKKTAKERKEILATLLGLDKYELLRKRAVEKITHLKSTKDHYVKLGQRLEDICLQEEPLAKRKEELAAFIETNNQTIKKLSNERSVLQELHKKYIDQKTCLFA